MWKKHNFEFFDKYLHTFVFVWRQMVERSLIYALKTFENFYRSLGRFGRSNDVRRFFCQILIVFASRSMTRPDRRERITKMGFERFIRNSSLVNFQFIVIFFYTIQYEFWKGASNLPTRHSYIVNIV